MEKPDFGKKDPIGEGVTWYSLGMGISFRWWIPGLVAGLVVVPLCVGACAATRAGYWSPRYTVVERGAGDVPWEVRQYAELVLAATPAQSEAQGRDGSFMRLFRFITGNNADARKIPMTTPVFFRGEGSLETMSFVMPQKDGQNSEPPRPRDAQVRIEKRPGGMYAVLRMTGRRRADRQRGVERLQGALAQSGWVGVGEAEFASYDPPWIPRILCRDEVFLPVKKRASH